LINSPDFAKQLDKEDALAGFREQFLIPQTDGRRQVYFLGNSLGLQSANMRKTIETVLGQWANDGVESFFRGNEPWVDYHDHLAPTLATITGALPQEITVMNQLTVNLHLMMASFYQATSSRKKIICEAKAFPSDQYMLHSFARHLGLDPDEVIVEVSPREHEDIIRHEDIIAAIQRHSNTVALVFFGAVNYYTGQLFDLRSITEAAHSAGAIVGFDCAHAVGNVALQLHDWNVDFACWCSYKYLNSGPGAIGGAFIHERYHHDPALPRLAGWWGHAKATRFLMPKTFSADASASGWQLSTPSQVLLAMHRAALGIFAAAGWHSIQAKQHLMKRFLWLVVSDAARRLDDRFLILTPRDPAERGSQLSLKFADNSRFVFDHLTSHGFMVDWREPGVLRLAPVPLYNTFEEIWQFGDCLTQIH
jgi:kynureninase